MENLFTDYEVLSGYMDKLLAVRYPGRDIATLQDIKNQNIIALDRRIVKDVFSHLPTEQVNDIRARMKNNEVIDFAAEFQSANLNLEDIMTETIKQFSEEFLGGQDVK